MFLPHPRVKVSIVGSLRDREVACSTSDRQGSNFESCVWRTVSSQSSHHPQEVLLAQFSLYVHKGGTIFLSPKIRQLCQLIAVWWYILSLHPHVLHVVSGHNMTMTLCKTLSRRIFLYVQFPVWGCVVIKLWTCLVSSSSRRLCCREKPEGSKQNCLLYK